MGMSESISATKESNDSLIENELIPAATPEMCQYCFDILINELVGGDALPDYNERSSAFLQTIPSTMKCPLFVTWDKKIPSDTLSGKNATAEALFRLRGCIGTLTPRKLDMALGDYALTSALRDHRFDPIISHEIPQLKVWVSLLVKYEDCDDLFDWEVGKHGIFIAFSSGSSSFNATYLPEIAHAQGWTKQQAIESLVRKAGYRKTITDELLVGIKCTRYQSSKQQLTYDRYVFLNGRNPVQEALDAHGN